MTRLSRLIVSAAAALAVAAAGLSVGAAAFAVAAAGEGPAPPAAGAAGGLKAELEALVESERAFNRMAADKGIRAAFLEYLSLQAVVFRPGPVDGRNWYMDRKDLTGALSWEPEFAEVARSGDLGYTTGPWEFRDKAGDKDPAACGHYVSIWRKRPDGAWRVVMDVGNTHPRHETPVSAGRTVVTRGEGPVASEQELAQVDAGAAKAAMMTADRAFSTLCAFKGAAEAYLATVTDDVRLYRRDAPPTIGKEAMRSAMPVAPALLTWRPIAGSVSRAGDLGFTYGMAELRKDAAEAKGEEFSYLRIWRRESGGEWKVALDLHNPIPQPATRPAAASSSQ